MARLLVTPDRVNPGGSVEVRGEDLPAGSIVRVCLTDEAGSTLHLGTAEADAAGHLVAALAIPPDLPPGEYELQAQPDGEPPTEAALIVEGGAVQPGGEPGAKDEDDMLLIALPSDWQRSLSGPVVTARPLTETLPAGSAGRGTVQPWSLVVLAGALAATAIVVVTAIGRRRTGSGPG